RREQRVVSITRVRRFSATSFRSRATSSRRTLVVVGRVARPRTIAHPSKHWHNREMDYLNVATYKFCTLSELKSRRERLRQLCEQLALRGTILLATEGINLFVAGQRPGIDELLDALQTD